MTYSDVKEELKNTYVVKSFNSRWETIEMWHEIGRIMLKNYHLVEDKQDKIADYLKVSIEDIRKAIAFADKYKNLNDYPSGMNISWRSVPDYSNNGQNSTK